LANGCRRKACSSHNALLYRQSVCLGITVGKGLLATALIALQPTGLVYAEEFYEGSPSIGFVLHATEERKRQLHPHICEFFARHVCGIFYTALLWRFGIHIGEHSEFRLCAITLCWQALFRVCCDEVMRMRCRFCTARFNRKKHTHHISFLQGWWTIAHVEDIAEPEYNDEKLVRFHGILHDLTDKVRHGKIMREHSIRFDPPHRNFISPDASFSKQMFAETSFW
jgi:hypothetical protein